MSTTFSAGGSCGSVRYSLASMPLFVHCCHCRLCQRESGASFALNAMIEADKVNNLGVAPELIITPSESGLGQKMARCPEMPDHFVEPLSSHPMIKTICRVLD